MKNIKSRAAGALVLAAALALAPAVTTSAAAANPNCPRYDTGRIKAGGVTQITHVAPEGRVILNVCVKGQGEAVHYPYFQGAVYSITFSTPTNAPIEHYSVNYSTNDYPNP